MEVKMDPDAKAQRRWQSHEKRPNLFQWLLIISLGVFIGNIATLGVERAVTYFEIYQLSKAAEAETEKLKLRLDAQETLRREQARIRAVENQKKEAGLRQALETCNYWRDQYREQPNNTNRYQRDQSCNFVNQFR